MLIKTGEVFYIDKNGELAKAASFQDENGVVTTELKVKEL